MFQVSDETCHYDVEFDIRDVKVTMDAENIRAKSVEMVTKELYNSIVAYNLVAQFRRQAAAVAGVTPRRWRFKGLLVRMATRTGASRHRQFLWWPGRA